MNLGFFETDVLFYVLNRPDVKSIYLKEAEQFGYEKPESELLWKTTIDFLCRNLTQAK